MKPEDHYIAIPIEMARKEERSVYFKVDNTRFIQLTKPGEKITEDNLKHLLKLGVSTLYIENIFIKPKSFSPTFVISNLFSISNSDEMERKFSNFLIQLKTNDEYRLNKELKRFLESKEQTKHGAVIAYICFCIISMLNIMTEKQIKQLIIAAFFHDIGEGEVLNTDQSVDKLHPLKSYDLLFNAGILDEESLRGVRQHHMRYEGESFPDKKYNETLSTHGQIIGLAEDVWDLVSIYRPTDTFQVSRLKRTILNEIMPKFNPLLFQKIKDSLIQS